MIHGKTLIYVITFEKCKKTACTPTRISWSKKIKQLFCQGGSLPIIKKCWFLQVQRCVKMSGVFKCQRKNSLNSSLTQETYKVNHYFNKNDKILIKLLTYKRI